MPPHRECEALVAPAFLVLLHAATVELLRVAGALAVRRSEAQLCVAAMLAVC